MAVLRRHLRAFTAAWLVCQLAAVAVFAVEPSCCPAHQGAAGHTGHAGHEDATPVCEDASTPAASCPMRGVTGEACPMHRQAETPEDPFHSGTAAVASRSVHAASSPEAPRQHDCAIGGLCDGPTAAIASLFPMPAVLADVPREVSSPWVAALPAADACSPAALRFLDTPPPRV